MSTPSQQITASAVAELRRKTGAGMMDCKEALAESGGDLEKAIEFLRKKGKATMRKRADRQANEGVIAAAISRDGHCGALAEVNSETDFVARNSEFRAFADRVAARVLEWEDAQGKTASDLLALSAHGDAKRTIADELSDLTGKIGEKLELRRFARLVSPSGLVGSYVHSNSKLGVLVNLDGGQIGQAESQLLVKDLAMQVAAAVPLYVHRQEIPEERLATEKEILAEQVKAQGKPPQVVERIVSGKLAKFYSELCLVDQPFVKDPAITIGDLISQAAQKAGRPFAVLSFIRLQVGE
ncbi:MAG: translation elongation factor Ts [bacterium]